MRALFVSAPLASHLGWGGYLETAAELVARQHGVLWISGAPVADAVARRGVPFRTVTETGWRVQLPPPLPGADEDARRLRALDQWLDPPRVEQAIHELEPVVREFRPDVIVGEMFMAAAALVAERYNVPFVVAGWPAPLDRAPQTVDPFLQRARGRLDQLLQTARVAGVHWTQQGPPALCSPHLHLSYWSRGWFAGLEPDPDWRAPYGSQTVHVGGKAPAPQPPAPDLPDPQHRPWVLITLGTTFNEDAAFFRMAAQAVVEMGGLPLVATGAPLDTPWVETVRRAVPPTTEIRAWVDLAAVLPYAAAAVHHGGAGTTHALITHAVPQIVVPHAADQMRQAYGVARTGIGVALLPKNTSVAALVQVLAQILPDRAPARAHVRTLQAEFAQLGGPSAAADRLEKVVEQGLEPESED